MKKNRLFLGSVLFALTCISFTSCESESESKDQIITFEDVTLGETGYWNGNNLSGVKSVNESAWGSVTEYTGGFKSGELNCQNIFNETYNSWSGMACSTKTDMDSIGYGNQYSVYATSGAGQSKKFAVLCPFDISSCSFSKEMVIKSLMINNATYAYWALKEGKVGYGTAKKFTAGDYFYITITGYDSDSLKTESLDFYLADFRDGKSYICKDWTKVDLTSLGNVKTLTFKLTSTDTGEWGMNTPGYACMDNIIYTQPENIK